MNEQNKKQIIIAGVLGVALVAVLVYQLFLAGDPVPVSTGAKTGSTQTTGTVAQAPPARVTRVAEATQVDIEELIRSVEVQPIDYAVVRVRRNLMEPLVGGLSISTTTTIEGGADGTGTAVVRTVARRNVTGIIWDPRRPVAIIDNMVVHEGYEFADGVVVHEIEPTRVLLKIGESISPLEMKEF